MKSEAIYERGLAIGCFDIVKFKWHFRFRDEHFEDVDPVMEGARPARCMAIYPIPELRYGWVARIDDVRKCAGQLDSEHLDPRIEAGRRYNAAEPFDTREECEKWCAEFEALRAGSEFRPLQKENGKWVVEQWA